MPSARDDLALAGRRRLRRSLVVACAVASSALLSAVLPGAAAVADDPAGTTVVGELVQAWSETDDHGHMAEGAPTPVSWVETAAGETVPVATADVAGVPAGSIVSVTVGEQVTEDGEAAHPVLDGEVLRTPVAEPAPAGPLTNQVTVAMVEPAGTPSGPRATRQQIVDLVDGSVAEFWAAETDGAVSIGVTASHDWISTTVGCAKPAALWNEAAAKVGFVGGPGKHLLVYLPPNAPRCAYALAEVGSSLTSGGRLYVRDASSSVIAHEFGHNFGLAHSSGRQCDGTVEAGTCRTVGYRDYYDVMGVSWARTGSLNVLQAARLGVLPPAQVQRVTVLGSAATVTLAPISGRSGVRALRLTDAGGVNYWLEYRPAAGRDAWLGTADDRFGLDAGVLLRRADRFPDISVLLDGTPSRTAGWDDDLQAALTVGAPVSVSGGQFTIALRSITAAGAVVDVVPSPPAVVPSLPAPAETGVGTVLPSSGEAPAAGALTGDALTGDAPVEAAEAAEAAEAVKAVEAAAQDPATAVAAPELAPLAGAPTPAEASLAAASESTHGNGGLVVAGLSTVLAGATTLVVRKLRRPLRG